MQLLKNVPNLQVVYIDSNQVNDAALGPLKDLAGLSALTIMSPQVTDAALENLKSLSGLTMLFLTSSKVSDKGLVQLKGLKNLQVLALSRTEVTDAGLDALKDIKSLKSIYLIGTKVTPQAIDKLKQAIPGVAVYNIVVASQVEHAASCLAFTVIIIDHSHVRRSHGLLCRSSEQPPKTDEHSSQADRDAQGKPDHRHARRARS